MYRWFVSIHSNCNSRISHVFPPGILFAVILLMKQAQSKQACFFAPVSPEVRSVSSLAVCLQTNTCLWCPAQQHLFSLVGRGFRGTGATGSPEARTGLGLGVGSAGPLFMSGDGEFSFWSIEVSYYPTCCFQKTSRNSGQWSENNCLRLLQNEQKLGESGCKRNHRSKQHEMFPVYWHLTLRAVTGLCGQPELCIKFFLSVCGHQSQEETMATMVSGGEGGKPRRKKGAEENLKFCVWTLPKYPDMSSKTTDRQRVTQMEVKIPTFFLVEVGSKDMAEMCAKTNP